MSDAIEALSNEELVAEFSHQAWVLGEWSSSDTYEQLRTEILKRLEAKDNGRAKSQEPQRTE